MAFSRKGASATVESGDQKINLFAEFDILQGTYQGFLDESQDIPDALLPDKVKEALKSVAQLIGFSEYDVDTISTLYWSVNKDSKKLYPPSLKAYGDGVAIVWGKKLIPVKPEELKDISKFSMSFNDNGPSLHVDISGYCMPIRVALSNDCRGENYKLKKAQLMAAWATGNFSGCLDRGEDRLKWSDVADGVTVEIHEAQAVMDREVPTQISYFDVLAIYNDQPYKMYAPGSVADWQNKEITEPIIFTKKGSIAVDSDGKEYSLGNGVPKLATLQIGIEYKVVGYKVTLETFKDNKQAYQAVIDVVSPDDGLILKVKGNTTILNKVQTNPVITQEEPATLVIHSIRKTDKGNIVMCSFNTKAEENDPYIQALKKREAELKAKNQAKISAAVPF